MKSKTFGPSVFKLNGRPPLYKHLVVFDGLVLSYMDIEFSLF